jgi:superfamily II DNA or RNA helicase
VQKVHVTLTEREAYITECPKETWQWLSDYWSFFVPSARFSMGYRHYLNEKRRAAAEGDPNRKVDGWDGRARLLSRDGTVPAGVFRATRKEIKELGIRFVVTYERPDQPTLQKGIQITDTKYRHQRRAVRRIIKAIPKGGGIVLSATGSGKTGMAAQLFSKLGWNCLFVVDQVNLLYQTQKELGRWLGEPVGIVGDRKYEVQRVTVGTVQTLSKHVKDKAFMKWYRTVSIVVIDELHVQMNRRNFKVLETIKPVARIGLTATMQMSKKEVRMKAWAFCGPVLYRYPISRAQAAGVVSSGQAVQLLFPQDEFAPENYQEAYEQEVVFHEGKLAACGRIVRWLIEKQDRRVILLVSRIAHVKELQAEFSDFEYGLAYGKVDKKQRISTLERFERGELKLIIANVVFEKGVDVKRVDVVCDMAEMKSKNTAVQKYGRGVRLHADKADLLYIDFGADAGRFGKAARSRARALSDEKIPVTKIKVSGPLQALKAVQGVVRASAGVKNVAKGTLRRATSAS